LGTIECLTAAAAVLRFASLLENLEDPTQHVWLSLLAKQKLNQHLCWLVGIHATDPNTGSSNACWDGEQGQDCVRQYSSDL